MIKTALEFRFAPRHVGRARACSWPRALRDHKATSKLGPRQRRAAGSTRAFTLIELLVVIGMIILLVGGGALALSGRGGEGVALSNAQSLVAGLVGSTRAQAALHQTNARLIVYAQVPPGVAADAAKYLRAFQVVRQETLPSGTTVWIAESEYSRG